MLRKLLLLTLMLVTPMTAAIAGEVTVRNKSIKKPIAIWVAEYKVGASKATRVKGPWKILPEEKKEWSKSGYNAFYERWLRYSYKKSNLKKEFTKSAWNQTGDKTGKKSIGSLTFDVVISDKKDKGVYKAQTETEAWLGDAWAATWDAIWGPISTAGDPVTIYNKLGTDQRIAEYQKNIIGECYRLQGGSDGILVPAFGEKTITKDKLEPGFTSRMIYFRENGDFFPDHKTKPYWDTHKNRVKGDGKAVHKLYLYVDKNGDPKIYNNAEWKFKQMGCTLLSAAVDVAGKAASLTALPDVVLDAIGMNALIEPIEDALEQITSSTVPIDDLKEQLQQHFDTDIGDANLTRMQNKVSLLNNKKGAFEDALKNKCFCNDGQLPEIEEDLKGLGLKVNDWINLNPSAPGHFFQGFSSTTSFSYKALTVAMTRSFVTDWQGERHAFFAFGVSAGTSIEKTPKVTRSLSLEFYPNIKADAFEGLAWDIGVAGGGGSYPFSGGASAFFAADSQSYIPDLSKLVGIGLSVSPEDESPPGGKSASFSAAGGVSYTFPAY